jgi:hypothetical protein
VPQDNEQRVTSLEWEESTVVPVWVGGWVSTFDLCPPFFELLLLLLFAAVADWRQWGDSVAICESEKKLLRPPDL